MNSREEIIRLTILYQHNYEGGGGKWVTINEWTRGSKQAPEKCPSVYLRRVQASTRKGLGEYRRRVQASTEGGSG